jgi:CheY-like chemotaxis protein
VIFNLVKNAVEAMPNGGNLGLSTLDTDDRVVLLVSDSGTGMDEATQLKLFQPFYTTKGPTRGRGLGMSSSLSLTTKHKGTLRVVESRLGEGTTLELALPAAAEPSSLIPQESSAAPEALRRLRVLWVDDEPDIRLSGCEILDLLGHLAVGAASAQEALDLALGQSFDLIISDLGMPEMNGWQLVRELERHHCLVPVVILTGWAGDPLTSTPTSSLPEVLDVLAKPLDLGQLKALLRRVAHLPPLPGND